MKSLRSGWLAACLLLAVLTYNAEAATGFTAVAYPPAINELAGDHVAYQVTVTGSGSVSYQWYFTNAPLAAQTNSTLVLTNIQTSNSGQYKVTTANGSVNTTNFVTLNVSTVPLPIYSSNLVVVRVGDGAQRLLDGTGNTVYLDQYTTTGVYVSSLMIPDESIGFPYGSGSSNSINGSPAVLLPGAGTDYANAGFLTLSANQQFLTLAGYCASYPFLGGDVTMGATGGAYWRGLATVDAFGTYSLACTNSGLYSGGNHSIRGAVTLDGSNFWTTGQAGSGGGLKYLNSQNTVYNDGSGIPSVSTSSTTGTRAVQIFGGDLIYSDVSASAGSGLYLCVPAPELAPSNSTTASLLLKESGQPNDFAISPDGRTIYIADGRAFTGASTAGGGIERWDTNTSGVGYVFSYTLPVNGIAGAQGLTVSFPTNVVLWGSNSLGAKLFATSTNLVLSAIVDNGSSSLPSVLVNTTLYNELLHGVRFGPQAASPGPPFVSITNPAPGANFASPANIVIAASAGENYGTVDSVSFYAGSNYLGMVDSQPFTLTWSNAPIGSNVLTAVAFGSTGLSTTSAPVSVTVYSTSPPIFAFDSSNYFVNENAGSVTVTVDNNGGLNGTVNYQTVDGTAFGGTGFSGSYTAASGSLTFSDGQTSAPLVIPILDNNLNGADIQFQVQLSNPSAGALGAPTNTTVTIHLNDAGGGSNSVLTTVAPTNPPAMNSQLTVFLTPTNVGQWRFPWDMAWRNSGDTVAGLVAGSYPVIYRNITNYFSNPPITNIYVTNATVVSNEYYPTLDQPSTNSSGSLTVNFTGSANGGGWQFVGDSVWLSNGITTNLLPDTYLIQFEPVSGWVAPPTQAIAVYGGASVSVLDAYVQVETPPSGTAFPSAVSSSAITNTTQPYQFNGQLQTDVGFGSGVVVRPSVVLTAAHLIFNDQTLSYVSQAYWNFQEEAGTFQPEPLAARGFYMMSGYASQRISDLTNGYVSGESSTNSQDLDLAALFFLSPAGRGGTGGNLTSDTTPNEWLSNASQKMVVGYPLNGAQFGYGNYVPGVMYATIPQTVTFTQETDQVYTTTNFLSFPGNDGGPIYVPATNNTLYPAAVSVGILGTLHHHTWAARAIDHRANDVIDTAAAVVSGGGTNILVAPGPKGSSLTVTIQIEPNAAWEQGGAWEFTSQQCQNWSVNQSSSQTLTSCGTYTVEFKPVTGWVLPVAFQQIMATLGSGQVVLPSSGGLYTLELNWPVPATLGYGNPLPSATTAIAVSGQTNYTIVSFTPDLPAGTPIPPNLIVPPNTGIAQNTVLPAGSYQLTASFTPSPSYNGDYGGAVTVPVNLTVTQGSLAIDVNTLTEQYNAGYSYTLGGANNSFTLGGSVSGQVNGDQVTPSYFTTTPVNGAGTYAISATVPAGISNNYVVNVQTGTLTIKPATLTVTASSPAPVPYGTYQGSSPETFVGTVSNKVPGDVITFYSICAASQEKLPQTYPITPVLESGSKASYYTIELIPGHLVIYGPAPTNESWQLSKGTIALTWTSAPGLMYEIQSTPALDFLSAPKWTDVAGPIPAATTPATTTTYSVATDALTSEFYQVVLLPGPTPPF